MKLTKRELEKLKEAQLKNLIEFDKVCKKLGINYTLSAGTLLGAVRHHGFIPWDDDIDVALLRADYDRFISEAPRFLPENLFVQTNETDSNYPLNFCKLIDISTTLIEYNRNISNMKTGIFIDIFPIDQVSSNKINRTIDNILLTAIHSIKYSYTTSNNILITIFKRLLHPISKAIGFSSFNKFETYIRTKNNNDKNKLTYGDSYFIPANRLKDRMLMEIDVFKEHDQISFEKYSFQSIKDKEAYLRATYGDYMKMPPVEERIFTHNFLEVKFSKQ